MGENVEDTRLNIYPEIIAIGCVISIWVTFLVYTIYPGIGKEFMLAMLGTWVAILFFWTWCDPPVHYQVEKLEREVIELKKEIIKFNKKGDDEGG